MIESVTLDQLYRMHLTGMVDAIKQQEQNISVYKDVSFEERLAMIVTVEFNKRESNALNKSIKSAGFRYPAANVESINYVVDRQLNKNRVERFAECNYIADKHNIVITGPTGSGKSYLACALGVSACRSKYKVKYIRVQELFNDIELSKKDVVAYKKFLNRLKKYNLLIIDDFLLTAVDNIQAADLLEIVEAGAGCQSIIFCSQYSINGWYDRLGDDEIAPVKEAAMDRIMHNSYEISLKGDVSMRSYYGVNKEGY